jgi:hypothetical protein
MVTLGSPDIQRKTAEDGKWEAECSSLLNVQLIIQFKSAVRGVR